MYPISVRRAYQHDEEDYDLRYSDKRIDLEVVTRPDWTSWQE